MRTPRWFRLATACLVAVVSVSFSAGVVGATVSTVDASSPIVLPQRTLHSTIAVGGKHTCAVVGAGAVWCWGNNSWGQLGNGSTTDSTKPVAVAGLTTARSIAAGSVHTCALMAAGSVACWGAQGDELGLEQLGWDGITHSDRPITVGGVTSATAIAASGAMTCALVSGGTVKCWGSHQTTPLTIAGLSGATAISVAYRGHLDSASRSRACALLGDGTVRCWVFTIPEPQFFPNSTITGLTPCHAYRFRIRAINRSGTSPYSAPSTSSRPT